VSPALPLHALVVFSWSSPEKIVTQDKNIKYGILPLKLMKFSISPRWPIYLLGSLILLLTLVTIVGDRGALHLWRLLGEKSRIDEQNYRMQGNNEALRQRIARVRHNDYYLEKLAREELNMVRPGEIVYRFSKSELRRAPSPAENAETATETEGSERK
jgi:cell division protein FtsB